MTVVGIDLGTTNSAVAMSWMGRPEIIPNRYGGRTTPSVVGMTQNRGIVVGHKARHQRIALLSPPVKEIKRKMGEDVTVSLGEVACSPQQISAYILTSLKHDAEEFLKEPVEGAVITIPAYFNEAARRATREAGELAGLTVGMILDEPTAAALAYGVKGDKEEIALVYDLGGGTLDVSVIEIAGNHFEVLAIDGNTRLGGKDFDQLLCDYVVREIRERHHLNMAEYPAIFPRLIVAVEAVKCDLSYRMDSAVIVEAVTDQVDVCVDIKRELLEELVRPLVNSTVTPIKRALEKADLGPEEIDEVVLVGGSTRMPLVREVVTEFFGRPPRCDINPDECVALGAALFTRLLDSKGTQKPHRGRDREVAVGENSLVVVPRTAHSLGIGADEGGRTFSVILPAGSFYPVSVTRKDYYTALADQSGIEFWVYEGEEEIAHHNAPLGLIRLELPQGLPAGIPVWITFTLNASRILEVTVQLPDRPQAMVKVQIQAQGQQSKTSLMRQIDSIAELLSAHGGEIAQSRHAEISWAVAKAREALDTGDMERAHRQIHLLEHVRDELSLLESQASE